MKRIHYISGLVIATFVGLHLFNHACSLFGADAHINVMNALRPIYRNVFGETLLLTAVLVQIVSGIKLFLAARKTSGSIMEKAHIWSGLYLAVFLIIHVGAVLAGRLFLKLDTNFYFGVAGLNSFPFNLFFIPYYALAVMAFFVHMAAVHSKKMTQAVFGLTPQKQAYLIMAFGFLVLVVLSYGLTNRFEGVDIPREYQVLIGK